MSENDVVAGVTAVKRRPPRDEAERRFWSFEESYADRVRSFVEQLSLRSPVFTPESLDEVEALFLDRVPAPDALDDAEARTFFFDVFRYVGETLLRTCGGEWEWEELWKQGGPGAGLPFVRVDAPDGYLRGGTVNLYTTLTGAAGSRTGHHFRELVTAVRESFKESGPLRRSSGWAAMAVDDPTATNPALREYLANHDAELQAFVAAASADGLELDFSEASLDRLEEVLLARYPDRPEMRADFDTPFIRGAARYLAATFTRIAGGRIDIVNPSVLTRPPQDNDKLPYVHRVLGDDGEASPSHSIGGILTSCVRAKAIGTGPRVVLPRTGDILRKNLHRYGHGKH